MGADGGHPSEQNLRAYKLGKLDDVSAGTVSTHLEGCRSCQRRVAALSSHDFLDRRRNAQGSPAMSAANRSQVGDSNTDHGPAVAIAPPSVDTMPPGLADHPDYEVLRELGHGGMGTVYLARNRLMRRHEVLKVVSSHLMNRRGVLDRFLGEIRNAARLHHTNIVTAFSATRSGDSIIFAMEYVEGLDLSRLVKTKGPLPVAHACNFVHQAAVGLQHAHDQGMVHRDIKPSNLMLASQGERAVIKVLDFGLAKIQSEGAVDGGLTQEGQMLGTPDYIAPEQITDARGADIRSDIYSLGCTLYYLLTGGPPFQATSLYELFQAHHSTDATPLNLVRPEVPVELAALVAKMMAKEPRRRFQTPKEVAQALTPFFKKDGIASIGSTPELSLAERTDAKPVTAGAVSVPARPAAELPPAKEPSVRKHVVTSRPEAVWKGPVDFMETEPVKTAAPAAASSRRPPWLWPAVAAGILLLGFVVTSAVVLGIKTSNGMIGLVKPPKDAGPDSTRTTRKDTRPDVGFSVKTAVAQGSFNNSIGMKFSLIPAGEFVMGSPEGDMDALNRRDAPAPGADQQAVLPGRLRSDPGAV